MRLLSGAQMSILSWSRVANGKNICRTFGYDTRAETSTAPMIPSVSQRLPLFFFGLPKVLLRDHSTFCSTVSPTNQRKSCAAESA